MTSNALADKLLQNTNDLFEASLSRVLKHWTGSEFVMITSWRQENSPGDNENNFLALKAAIRSMGLGFVQVEGYGQEDSDSGVVTSQEPALLVVNRQADPDFLQKMLELGNSYNQYAIVHALGDGSGNLVLCASGSIDMKFASLKAAAGQFFTRLNKRSPKAYKHPERTRKAQPVTQDFRFEGIRVRRSSTTLEARSRQAHGEGLDQV